MNATTPRKEKRERLEARLNSKTKKLIQNAADLEGRTLSDFVISSAVTAAKNVIREHVSLELSMRDQIIFAETLANPPEPVENLRIATSRYKSRENQK